LRVMRSAVHAAGQIRAILTFPTRRSSDLKGNFSLAAHRDGHGAKFHGIHRIGKGDAIVFETKDTWYVYKTIASPLPIRWMPWNRSEEHTSELQSRANLVCRRLPEKANKTR